MKANLETLFALAGLPKPEREYFFLTGRLFRFDWAWPSLKLAVEYEGGVYTRGRHVRPDGFITDCVKYNEAALAGWRVLRFTVEHVRDGTALDVLTRAAKGQ